MPSVPYVQYSTAVRYMYTTVQVHYRTSVLLPTVPVPICKVRCRPLTAPQHRAVQDLPAVPVYRLFLTRIRSYLSRTALHLLCLYRATRIRSSRYLRVVHTVRTQPRATASRQNQSRRSRAQSETPPDRGRRRRRRRRKLSSPHDCLRGTFAQHTLG
jgi:hypothetical protein